ncbi:unnamed protein product [Psylliodes chrysocephalus]|uniref:Uncharacterized protein n=1 Tax=Psylliodes chrysocephalus TaxID=3402493 RepID=A0A9P0CKY0_9CUCU|nr:unnamed protein product [Psylliodes chrysocephala]
MLIVGINYVEYIGKTNNIREGNKNKGVETLKRKKPEERSDSSDSDGRTSHKKETATADSNLHNFDQITSASSVTSPRSSCSKDLDVYSTIDDSNENDIGRFVGRAATLSTERKKEILENCWIPPKPYDFAKDDQHLKRKFNHS